MGRRRRASKGKAPRPELGPSIFFAEVDRIESDVETEITMPRPDREEGIQFAVDHGQVRRDMWLEPINDSTVAKMFFFPESCIDAAARNSSSEMGRNRHIVIFEMNSETHSL